MVRMRKLPSSASLGWRQSRLDEPQCQPIAAVAALVVHPARETAHEVDADITDLGLLERPCRCRQRRSGGIELAAVVLDAGDQGCAITLELDRNLERIGLRGNVHYDVGDGLLKAKLHSKRDIRRGVRLNESFDPASQPLQFGNVVAQYQTTRLDGRHRDHDARAAVAAASVS